MAEACLLPDNYRTDREVKLDERAGKDWSNIIEAREGEINALAEMLYDLRNRGRKAWTFANIHYEGFVPLTIKRIRESM